MRIDDIIVKFQYKPGVRFAVNERYESIDVNLYADVPDSNDPRKTVTVHIWRTLDPWLLNEDRIGPIEIAIKVVEALVREFELHETDEWLRYKGERLTNPHPENESALRHDPRP